MALNIEPAAATVPAGGGVSKHAFQNPGEGRLVFKVKATNNDHYRVKPVYGFVDPGAATEFEITRTAGPPKEDKFVVQFAAAPEGEANAENAFKATAPAGEANITITATE